MKKMMACAVCTMCAFLVVGTALPLFAASKAKKAKKSAPSAEELVSKSVTTRYFSEEPVPESDIDKILTAGVNTESASNKQPWHFTAVTSKETLKDIFDTVNARRQRNGQALLAEPQAGKPVETNIAHIPLLIIVSADKGAELNAGLAAQSMAVMAQILGYGTKVESSPAAAINEKLDVYAPLLGIPEGKQAVTVIKIGKADENATPGVDGYSGATVRNSFDQMTTKVK